MDNQKNAGAGRGVCTVLVTLVLVVCLVVAFTVDITTCPECKGHEILYALTKLQDCPTCHSKGKVTLAEYLLSGLRH